MSVKTRATFLRDSASAKAYSTRVLGLIGFSDSCAAQLHRVQAELL